MCKAHVEIGLFVWIYLVCSRCHISIELPVWPKYDLLHVLHCNLYMPLEVILFSGVLSHNWLYIVLHARNAMFKSVLFNRYGNFVYNWTVVRKCDPFLSLYLCECAFCFCVLSKNLFFKLWMICDGKPLFLAMMLNMFHSCCLACSVIGIDNILLM
jgi:hypothetical protein